MRKKLFALCGVYIAAILMLTSCQNAKSAYTVLADIGIKSNGHTTQLHDYDSPYTICYENSDGTYSMYIFSAPIQYKTDSGYAVIDNAIVKSKKDGYIFENKANDIKTYFRKSLQGFFRIEREDGYIEFMPEDCKGFSEAKHITYTNMYGTKVDAVRYERNDIDLVFYPVRSGIKMEVVLKEKPKSGPFTYFVQTQGSSAVNDQNGYVLFKNGNSNAALVYQPLVSYQMKEGGNQLDISSTMEVGGGSGVYTVKIHLNQDILDDENLQYPVKFDPSFELYLNKLPDTSVYSKFDINSYLRHYAIIGEHPELGEGWEYIRLRLNYFMTLSSSSIISSTTNFRILNQNKSVKSELYALKEDWSSTKMTWENRVFSESSSRIKPFVNGLFLSFDITDIVKECFESGNKKQESFGYVLRHPDLNDYLILASSDNGVYSPFVEICVSRLPVFFDALDNINIL